MSTSGDPGLGVGPVLHATPFARAVVSVIEEENTHVLVHDEGAYLRVLVPLVCRLSRAGLEAATGLRHPVSRRPGGCAVVVHGGHAADRRRRRLAARARAIGGNGRAAGR